MQPVAAPLSPGDVGPAVANLQDALQALVERQVLRVAPVLFIELAPLLGRERAESRFGDATTRLVRTFRVQEGLGDDGGVDEPTAKALNTRLREIGALVSSGPGDGGPDDQPAEYVVSGRVVGARRGLSVRVYAVAFRSEQKVSEAQIRPDLSYEARYPAATFPHADTELAALRIAVCDEQGREVGSSPTVFTAAADARIDVTVLSAAGGVAEYDRYVAALEPVLHGVSLADLDRQKLEVRDREIDFLAGDTGIDRQHVMWLALAAGFEARGRARGVPAPVFYAWLRQGLPGTWETLVALPPSRLRTALVAAADAGIVARELATGVEAFLDAMPDTGRGVIRGLGVGAGLAPARVDAVLRRADAVSDLKDAALRELVAAGELQHEEAVALGLTVTLHFLVGGDDAAVVALRDAHFDSLGGVLKRPRDLAALTAPDIRRALDAGGVTAAGPALDAMAAWIVESAARTFHGDALLHRVMAPQADLSTHLQRLAPVLALRADALRVRFDSLGADAAADTDGTIRASHRALTEYVNLHPGLGLAELLDGSLPAADAVTQADERVGWLRTLYAENADLDLLSIDYLPGSESLSNVSFGGLADDAQAKVVAALKAYQRVKALSDNALTSTSILKAGYASASTIARLPFEAFAAATGLPPEVARASYAIAKDQADAAALTFFSVQDLVRDSRSQRRFLFSVPAELARLAGYDTLFGSLTGCDCEHCRSIFGPAAYFVDLMFYVERFILADSFANAGGEGNELHLKSRRPDLWTLPLTCENTEQFVPTLDIVNRVLEGYIAASVPAAQAGVFEMLATCDGSIRQPFVWPLERLTGLLAHFEIDRGAIARLFVLNDGDADRRSRVLCALGLSPKDYDIITGTRLGTPISSATLAAAKVYYESQLQVARNLSTIPGDVETRYIDPPPLTGIVAAMDAARDVLLPVIGNDFVNLPATPADSRARVERGIMGAGSVQNDAEIVRQLTFGRLDRLERFVRLWRHVPWNVVELDYVLARLQAAIPSTVTPAPDGRLDVDILDALCRLIDLQRRWPLPVDELCALWDDLPVTTLRESPPLLDRVFNQPIFVKADTDRLPQSGLRFAFPELPAAPDAALHARMLAALKVSDQELADLFAGLDPGNAGLTLTTAHLASLYRHAALARLLRVGVRDLFRIVDLAAIPGGSIAGLTDLRRALDVQAWIAASGVALDEIFFITGRTQQLPSRRSAADMAAALVSEVQADGSLTFADTVFAEAGLSESQSRSVVADNLSAAPGDGRALERAVGSTFRLAPAWDPDDATAAFTFTPVASDDMVAATARAAYDLAKAGGSAGFARDAFVALGMDAAASGAFVDANLHTGNDGKAFEATGNAGGYRLIADITADDAVRSFLASSTAELRAARTTTLEQEARALLARRHPLEIVVAKMAAALQTDAQRTRALLNLVKPSGTAGRADSAALAVALQGGDRQPLDELAGRLARVAVLCADPAFDADALAFVAGARSVFGVPDAPASLSAQLTLGVEAVRLASLYAAAAKSPNRAYEPDADAPDVPALQEALQPQSPARPLQSVDAGVLARALRTDRAQMAALLRQLQGELADGLDGIRQLRRALEWCARLGVGADTLKLAVSEDFAELARAADGIQGLFRSIYKDDKTYSEKLEPFEDRIRGRRRDGLVDYLLHPPIDVAGLPGLFLGPDDLFAFFLIDVMVEGCARTSELVSAIAGVQLYVHRVLMHLERSVDGTVEATLRDPERAEWSWRQHYRLWEANRKVFLYPENYIEPGLRDDKTPLFKALEDTLLQKPIDDQNVLDAYANYLHGFDELARLRIAGAYHDQSGDPDVLHLFGTTASDPPVYYYRTIRNLGAASSPKAETRNKTTFGPWLKVDAQIPVRKVSPIVFAGRLYVFWVETTTRPLNEFVDGSSTFTGYRHSVRTKFTQLRLDGRWTPPQTVKVLDDAGAAADARIVGDPLTGGRTQVFDDDGKVYGDFDLNDPKELQRYSSLLAVLALAKKVAHTRPVHQVATWDVRGRDQTEPIEGYSPDGFKWDRTYPATETVSGDDALVTMFLPRTPGQANAVREQIELWEATAVPLQNQTAMTYFLEVTSGASSQGFALPGFSLPARFDAQIVNGNYASLVYEAGGEALLAFAVGAGYQLWRLSSRILPTVGERLAVKGIPGVLDVDFQGQLAEPPSPFGAGAGFSTDPTLPAKPFAPLNALGGYFREVFFHIPFLIADHLNSQQKFDAAQQWYHYLYDPTASGGPANDAVRPWRFLEFQAVASQNQYPALRDILTNGEQIEKYRSDPFNPHAIARLRAGAYQKSIVMKYIDNLIDWADTLFAQFTLESINEATLLYVMAADILGPRPVDVGPCTDEAGKTRTYESIAPSLRDGKEHDLLIEEFEVLQIGPRPNPDELNGVYVPATAGGGPVRLQQAVMAPGALDADGAPLYAGAGAGAVPMGWNQAGPTMWTATGGTALGDVYAGGGPVVPSALTVGGTNGRAGVTGDPIDPPPPSIGTIGGFAGGVGGLQLGPTVGRIDVRYGLGDIQGSGRPPDRVQVPSLTPAELVAAKIVFCIPENTDLLAYWDRVADRLYKVRNCMDISGVRRQPELFAPEIDPRMLVRMRAAGLSLDDVMNATSGNLPPYRFLYLIERARQHAAVVQAFGAQLLTALGNRDAEELARLRTTHEQNLLTLRSQMMQWEIDAANDALESLQRQKASLEYRRDHFKNLSSNGLLPVETQQSDAQDRAQTFQQMGALSFLLSAMMNLVPELGAPTALKFGGKQIGDSLYSAGTLFNIFASANDSAARAAGLLSSFARRAEDWTFQAEVAKREILQIESQIAAAEIRRDIATQSQAVHQRSIDQTQEIFDFLGERFTSLGRFTWLSAELQKLNRMAFTAALSMARLAERAYRFERPDDLADSLTDDDWDAENAGLLAGDRLLMGLQRLEQRFIETNYRSLEIEQSFSLAQLAPAQLLRLREKGTCTFTVPEAAFDLTYPGQYRRRIKAVRLSIPCVIGPYLNVGATLRLTGSRIRLNPRLGDPLTDVPRRHTSTIGASSGQNDAGVFEFSFRDERYMPFEGAGAISDWQLDLPATFRPFDYRSIGDVVLRIAYTAEEDLGLRDQVEAANDGVAGSLLAILKAEGLPLGLSLRHDFPDAWRMLVTSSAGTVVTVELGDRYLPAVLADWLSGRIAASARLSFGGANDPTTVALVTRPAGAAIATVPTIVAWIGDATPPTPEPAPLAFTRGSDGMYTAPLASGGTLEATAPTVRLRLRLDSGGSLAAPAATGSSIDEDRLSDIALVTTARLGS